MLKNIPKIISQFTNLLFPIKCLGCGIEGSFLCPDCLNRIPLLQDDFSISDKNNKTVNGLIVASDYDHPLLKEAVLKFKYDFIKGLGPILAQLMIKKLSQNDYSFKNSVLMPVPLHPRRLRWRGFNQSEILAREIGQNLNLPVLNDVLIRGKNTEPQVGLVSADQRKQNIKNAFRLTHAVQNRSLTGRNIVIVDDVATTLATISECAKALKPLHPKSVWGLVLAKG